jgi:hypothetical protein
MGPYNTPSAAGRELAAQLQQVGWQCVTAQRRLVHLAAAVADADVWLLDGAPTAAHWIAEALDVEECTAREWIRIGRALRELRGIDAAFEDRALSYSKVRQLSRVATAGDESELVEIAMRTPAGRLCHELARWRASHETYDETERRHRRDRGLTWRTDVDGMVTGTFRLPPADAARLIAAIDAHVLGGHLTTKRALHRVHGRARLAEPGAATRRRAHRTGQLRRHECRYRGRPPRPRRRLHPRRRDPGRRQHRRTPRAGRVPPSDDP